MKLNNKALLVSIFIFPGAGQFVLKRYKSAAVFLSITLIAIAVILIDIFSRALKITDKILAGEVVPDIAVIRKLITEQGVDSGAQWVTVASILLAVMWLGSIVDVYRLRRSVLPLK